MESSSRTLVCSVLFLDIIEYSKKPVAEQLQLKQSFNRMLATALEQVPQRDRIILDTGDGAAVTFLGDPEDALFAALTVRNMTTDVPVRLGVNLGPVRLVKDLNGQMNIIGDGINVAQRVMGFAQPGQLLVSRSFYEVVSCLSRDYLKLFRHEGSRTDKHVREHEVYSVVGGAMATRRLAHTEPRLFRGDGAWLAGTGPFGLKRSALVAAPLAFLLMVVGGVAARSVMEPQPQQQSDAGVANTPVRDAPVAAPTPVPTVSTGPASDQKPAAEEPITPPTAPDRQSPDKRRVAKKPSPPSTPAHAKPAIAAAAAPVTSPLAPSQPPQPAAEEKATVAPGRIDVVVLPWGEIVVDGRVRGVSPPLRMLEIPAGSHTIELRNTTFPKRVERIEVKAGESVRIRHRFR